MKSLKYLLYLLLPLSVLTSCNDLLDVNTKNFADSNNNTLSSPNDSVYSIFGILSQLQKLGDSYVVLGELRGDLLDVTDSTSNDLREINSFNISETNSYLGVAKYYTVINNCNYVIAHMDTTIGGKALKPDYAAAVAIRAWTYFQLATNYKDVRYSEAPVESVQQAKDLANFPIKTRDEIFDLLIPQLQSIENAQLPLYSINGISVSGLVPDTKTILADMFLWKGGESDLINAATYYKKMLESDYHYRTYNFAISYSTTSATFSSSWPAFFIMSTSLGVEDESVICYSAGNGNQSQLPDLFVNKYMIKPSSLSVDNWISQSIMTAVPALLTYGDRRGYGGSWSSAVRTSSNTPVPTVIKYHYNSGSIILSRSAKYLLRYAEAINRLGKPTLALAVVNYGLTQKYVYNAAIVKPTELTGKPYYLNFDNKIYYWGNSSSSLQPLPSGIRDRVGLNPVKFPTNLQSLSDSILFVENTIINEAGLETAFEGNRWTDLVRVALRRLPSATTDVKLQDPNFLGNMVARKFEANPKSYFPFTPTANAADVKSRLNADQSLWFLPFK